MATVPACQVPAVTMPAEEMSKLEVSMTNPDEPPPMVVVPVEVPVLIWVSKLDEWLSETALPVEVRPVKTAWPPAVRLPELLTTKLVKLIRLVPAVVPEMRVSQPEPNNRAFDPDPPVAVDMLRAVPVVTELASMLKRPAPL